MLETVSKGFKEAKRRLLGDAITEQAISDALRDIRLALLEADVDLGVAKTFLTKVEERAKGELVGGVAKIEVKGKVQEVTPYHRFIAICQEE
ncbi:signal recognition particle receptor subunit alpha, partial [Myxococcota bacterium]|nr:signal recognition particle receptor subunit alpha [Myxococcota bacterium]